MSPKDRITQNWLREHLEETGMDQIIAGTSMNEADTFTFEEELIPWSIIPEDKRESVMSLLNAKQPVETSSRLKRAKKPDSTTNKEPAQGAGPPVPPPVISTVPRSGQADASPTDEPAEPRSKDAWFPDPPRTPLPFTTPAPAPTATRDKVTAPARTEEPKSESRASSLKNFCFMAVASAIFFTIGVGLAFTGVCAISPDESSAVVTHKPEPKNKAPVITQPSPAYVAVTPVFTMEETYQTENGQTCVLGVIRGLEVTRSGLEYVGLCGPGVTVERLPNASPGVKGVTPRMLADGFKDQSPGLVENFVIAPGITMYCRTSVIRNDGKVPCQRKK